MLVFLEDVPWSSNEDNEHCAFNFSAGCLDLYRYRATGALLHRGYWYPRGGAREIHTWDEDEARHFLLVQSAADLDMECSTSVDLGSLAWSNSGRPIAKVAVPGVEAWIWKNSKDEQLHHIMALVVEERPSERPRWRRWDGLTAVEAQCVLYEITSQGNTK